MRTSSKTLAEDKKKADDHFFRGEYDQAIRCYSELLKLSDTPVSCYVNRALCYIRLGDWPEVRDNAIKALDIDPTHVKANFYLGIADLELGRLAEAITCFEKARDFANEKGLNYGTVIADQLRQAYVKRWELYHQDRKRQYNRLVRYVEELVDPMLDHRPERKQLKEELLSCLAKLDREDKNVVHELPDYLTCQLCYDLLSDPVITPSGITYCRKCIEANIYRVSHVDPMTSDHIDLSSLVPNLCIREAAQKFAEETDWFARNGSC